MYLLNLLFISLALFSIRYANVPENKQVHCCDMNEALNSTSVLILLWFLLKESLLLILYSFIYTIHISKDSSEYHMCKGTWACPPNDFIIKYVDFLLAIYIAPENWLCILSGLSAANCAVLENQKVSYNASYHFCSSLKLQNARRALIWSLEKTVIPASSQRNAKAQTSP